MADEKETPGEGGEEHLVDDEMVDTDGADTPEARVAELEDQLAEANERILRLAADLENTRRRADREKQDAARYGLGSFAKDLIEVADNFERALQAAPEDAAKAEPDQVKNLIVGVQMTEKALLSAFERHGLKKIHPAGEKFDPHLHQAVAEVPGAGEPKGHVVDVAQAGFVIGDRVLRAAMVTVSTGAGAQDGAQGGGETPGAEPGARVDRSV